MPKEIPQLTTFLKGLSLFSSLDEQQISHIASQFHVEQRVVDDLILRQGDRAEAFYIIIEGQVEAERRISQKDSQTDVFVSGDFFGEDSILQNRAEPASIIVLTPLTVISLERAKFRTLIQQYPSVQDQLNRFIKSHQYINSLHFDWLNEDEVVYQVRRRHVASLMVALILPSLIIFLGLGIAGYLWFTLGAALFESLLLIVAAGFLGIGFGWTIWAWIDWGNDYYIITNQRVAWIEKVIWLYDSRIEAPLDTILSVDVNTTLVGRMVGFGNVIVTTYTGKLFIETVNNPYQLSSLIAEYWHRARSDVQRADQTETRNSIRKILGEKQEQSDQDIPVGAKAFSDQRSTDEFRDLSGWDKYFTNIFKLRIETGKVITYRKHWLILLKKTLLPGLISLGLLSLILVFDIMYILGEDWAASALKITFLGGVVLVLFLFPWWLYHYIDWRNDIYQVTDQSIFDIERKPLGTEFENLPPWKMILSLEHKRPGFFGYIFNVGLVTINVGEAKFDFEYVYQPARVQQDIFNKMHLLRLQKLKVDEARQRARILDMIEIYHDEVEGNH